MTKSEPQPNESNLSLDLLQLRVELQDVEIADLKHQLRVLETNQPRSKSGITASFDFSTEGSA